jgi:hypothetical protein
MVDDLKPKHLKITASKAPSKDMDCSVYTITVIYNRVWGKCRNAG